MSKASTETAEPEKQLVYVPVLGRSIEAVDQADVEKQVKAALKQEDGDANN